jgi:hypothetical protein
VNTTLRRFPQDWDIGIKALDLDIITVVLIRQVGFPQPPTQRQRGELCGEGISFLIIIFFARMRPVRPTCYLPGQGLSAHVRHFSMIYWYRGLEYPSFLTCVTVVPNMLQRTLRAYFSI